MTPKLTRVVRLDSLPLNQTYFTSEGYLIDRPILTSTGIFEYTNPDGSIRRELRLPDEVFSPESLKSYKAKPVIVTHNAGLITKDNVRQNEIGTILSEGYRSGNDVRAEIVIHDTNGMKISGLKELSLGYNLELDETPGEWNGEHYDAIQRNITINHLALVFAARAGEQARLNIDSRDRKNLQGGKPMQTKKNTRRADSVLSPEELEEAINAYKAKHSKNTVAQDAEPVAKEEPTTDVPVVETPVKDGYDTVIAPAGEENPESKEAKIEAVKANRDRRYEEGEPEDKEASLGVIAQQDEDIGILLDIIDTLLAERAFDEADKEPVVKDEVKIEAPAEEPIKEDAEDTEPTEESMKEEENTDGCGKTACDTDCGPTPKMNADSIDAIVRQRIRLGMLGQSLNLDGLENMSIIDAKKAIISVVRPTMHLDGKSEAFIDGAFNCASAEIKSMSEKNTAYQKRQMFNKDSAVESAENGCSSADARQRMINRQMKKEDK